MLVTGYRHFATVQDEIIFGHEYCGEVVDYGPGSRGKLA